MANSQPKPKRLCCRYDLFVVTQWKDDCIYKAEIIGEGWFLMGYGPETNKLFDKDKFWVPTMDNAEYRTDYQNEVG